MLSRHSSHWNIHKRDESRQTLAVLSPKPRNGCRHFKRPLILLAQDCPVWDWPRKTSERSSPRGRGKDSLPEWVRAGPCCLPHRTRQASSSTNFDRSLRWFVVLLALLSHFLVARATGNCRYSCPVQRYWLKKACTAAAAAQSARACMHAHNSSSIGRRPQFRSVTRSWIWIRALRMSFSSSLEVGYVVLGLLFPFPNSQSTWQVSLRCLIAADPDRRSHSPLPPGNHVKHSFRKARQLWTLSKLPRPVITSRREEKNNKAKVFQHPINSHSQSASSCLISPHFAAGAVGVGRGAASFLATESTGTRSYTQTDDMHCWPCLSISSLTLGRIFNGRLRRPPLQTYTNAVPLAKNWQLSVDHPFSFHSAKTVSAYRESLQT